MATLKKIQCQFVTYNDGSTVIECIRSVLESTFNKLQVDYLVIDNRSTDGSVELIQNNFSNKLKVVVLDENVGFAGGHNWGVRYALENGYDYIAVLNPDLLLEKDCIQRLIEALSIEYRIGISTPKLYRTTKSFEVDKTHIDACGMYFLSSLRHLDRTENYSSQRSKSEFLFNTPSYAIGASGACFVISADCVRDVSFPKGILDGEKDFLFDPDFFVYREDAELALRSQWMGWKTIYQPNAVGYHKRFVRPDNRNLVPESYNRMSVRNRFLFQGNDISLSLFFLTFPNAFFRNVLVVIGCLVRERSSVPGLKEAFSLRGRTWKKRKWIMKNRKASNLVMNNWFSQKFAFPPALLNKEVVAAEKIKKVTVTAVVINYFQSEQLESCLNSLAESNCFSLKKIVVNNSRDDLGVKQLKEKSKDVVIIDENKNYGFAGAINLVASRYESDFLLILNPDIVLDSNAILNCLQYFQSNQNLGAISPLLIDSETNLPQIEYSLKRLPRMITLLGELPGIKYLFSKNPIHKFQFYKDDQTIMKGISERNGLYEVEQLAGACLLVRRKAFDEVDGFDESFYPAWFEDVDFAQKLFLKNYVSALNCNSKAMHIGGTSTSSLGKAEFLYMYYKNYRRLWTKYHPGVGAVPGLIILTITFYIKRNFLFEGKEGTSYFANFFNSIRDTFSLIKDR